MAILTQVRQCFEHCATDLRPAFAVETEHDEACVFSWRKAPDIAQPLVEGEKHPSSEAGCASDGKIRLARETFRHDSIHVVPERLKILNQFGGKVLVEFDAHGRGAAPILPRARDQLRRQRPPEYEGA